MITNDERALCLVTGASGVIGPALVHSLLEKNYSVRVLVREQSDISKLPSSIEIHYGDIRNKAVLSKAVEGADLVFHLAAKLHVYNPHRSLEKKFWDVNVEATKQLIDQAEKHAVKRFVYFSTINVYGSGDGKIVFDEKSELAPESLYAKTKAAAEKFVLDAVLSENNKPMGTVLRLAAVYGPAMKGNYLQLLRGLKQGWFIPIGPGENRRTLIFLDDAVQGAILASLDPKAAGEIYNLTDGSIYPFQMIIEAMCKAVNRKKPEFYLPIGPVRFGVGLIEGVLNLFGIKTPWGRETLTAMLDDRAVSGEKIQQELNFKFEVDLRRGWELVNKNLEGK